MRNYIAAKSGLQFMFPFIILFAFMIPGYSNEFNNIFGYTFLRTSESDTARAEIHYGVLQDYLLKPQDEINIDIWGDLKLHYSLTIDPDGYIVIPEAGRISLNGLTYAEAKSKILKHLASTYSFYINHENPGTGKAPVDIALGKTSGINVFVTGEVVNLGDININSTNASIISVLKKSGITEQASLRTIELKKINGKIYHFDLYEFLIKGSLPNEFKYLSDGDIIFVPMRNKEITLSGSVKKPGLYEILPNEKLNDALKIASGVKTGAQKEIKIFRKSSNPQQNIDEITVAINADPVLENEDRVFVPGSSENKEKYYVTLTGEVISPGNYTYIKYETLNDLVKRSGGLETGAFLTAAELRRNGNVTIIELEKARDNPKSNFNFEILPGDEIVIHKKDSFITVRGAVIYPSNYLYKEGESAAYYIKNAGGYTKNADNDNVMIYNLGIVPEKAFSGFLSTDPVVPQGAVIDVPEINNSKL